MNKNKEQAVFGIIALITLIPLTITLYEIAGNIKTMLLSIIIAGSITTLLLLFIKEARKNPEKKKKIANAIGIIGITLGIGGMLLVTLRMIGIL